ncbi:MAG: asparagine synthase (glutamine-hydrolyzing) [Thermodesulfovibrionales bacterium]
MCGILGIIDYNGIDEALLKEMRDTMSHRGPDTSGLWINPNKTVGLAHRRLSILDLSEAGGQPMSDDERRVWITYNGEIYNFKEIRKELEKKGYTFKSNTDTEVIINAYKEWAIDCLQRFNGMFAFGIYDDKEKILFLARDRVGKKPLYYSQHNGRFVFASEIKAILKDKSLPREIDLRALNFYLTFGYIPGELCIFKWIKKLPPSHAMIYYLNTCQKNIWSYWDAPQPMIERVSSEDELLEELEMLLKDAVRLRMISDVPLGAFLSGGVDSSLVVAMMNSVSNTPVKTFSIGFEEDKYNELPYARIVANYFNTIHHEIIVKPDAFSILPELVRQFDEPFADSSMIPTYYVSKATREYVTVALSGDGGDELFGGYSSYLGTLGNYYLAKFIPSFLRKEIAKIAELAPEKVKGKRQLLRLRYNPYDAFIDRISHRYFKERYRKSLLSGDIIASLDNSFLEPENFMRRYLSHGGYDFINHLTYTDFKTYLPDDILVKVDRASMLVSLEVRAPFLDYRIVEFSFKNILGNLKIKGLTTKYLLKKLAQRILPKELKINRKWGFAIPISEWFRGPLFAHIKEILMEDKDRLFQKNSIQRLLEEHLSGVEHGGRLFVLLVFALWKENIYNR